METSISKTIGRCVWQIIKASLLTLILYMILSVFALAVADSVKENYYIVFSIIQSVILELGFCIVLIWITYSRNGQGEDIVVKQYKDVEYRSFFEDIKLCINTERYYLILFWGINVVIFILRLIERGIFDRLIISNVAFLFFPLVVLCESIHNIAGYLLSSLIISIAYLLGLGIVRRKWYAKWYSKR